MDRDPSATTKGQLRPGPRARTTPPMSDEDDIGEQPIEPVGEPEDLSEGAPDIVLELAASAFRMVKQTLKIDLDFTPETLPLLDHHLRSARAEAKNSAELRELVATSAGGYLGEVVRRHLPGARWHVDPADFGRWRIELDHVFLYFNPIAIAFEVLAGGDTEGWSGHLEVLAQDRGLLEQALSRMGDVAEDDYYTLAVRYEVIEQVISALEGAQVARGEAARRFDPEVYAAAVGERAMGLPS